MTDTQDRAREIAHKHTDYCSDESCFVPHSARCNALTEAIRSYGDARAAEARREGEREGRRKAAKVARGIVCFDYFRTWPWWKFTNHEGKETFGSRHRADELVQHCDKIADAILALDTPEAEAGR